jgi:hypothetical protein
LIGKRPYEDMSPNEGIPPVAGIANDGSPVHPA